MNVSKDQSPIYLKKSIPFKNIVMSIIKIFTDGSCHTQLKTGAWVALIFVEDKKIVLQNVVENTTHNRMELSAVIAAIHYVTENNFVYSGIEIYSDSQYVVDLVDRKERLKNNLFITKNGTPIQNADLVQNLVTLMETFHLTFIKVKAHQRSTSEINYNREADILVRSLVRSAVGRES